MNHSFDIELAKKYGMLEAVLINHFKFWIAKNKANNSNYFDGKCWVYNSVKAFSELFPYVSEKQIRTALNHLRDEKVLIISEHNKKAYDRTLWYTLSSEFEEKSGECQKGQLDLTCGANGFDQEGKPIPDINTDNNIFPPIIPPRGKAGEKKKSLSVQQQIESLDATESFKSILKDFAEMRQKIKKPLTAKALTLVLNKLNSLSSQEEEQIAILEQSVMNSWQGVFPLKKDNGYYSPAKTKEQLEIEKLYDDFTDYGELR